jgi:hypothetical protein
MSWAFGSVRHTKAEGTAQPVYTFPITSFPEDLAIVSDAGQVIAAVAKACSEVYAPLIVSMYEELLRSHKSMFAKAYLPAQMVKITQHAVLTPVSPTGTAWLGRPVELTLRGGRFILGWMLSEQNIQLSLDEEALRSRSNSLSDMLEVVDIADEDQKSSVHEGMTEVSDNDIQEFSEDSHDALSLRSIDERRLRERQRIEEARLRARLAAYKAERLMVRYAEKYGEVDISDSEDSESDDSSDSL